MSKPSNSQKIKERYLHSGENPKYDIEKGILYNPKIWGKNSKNGYLFTRKVMEQALDYLKKNPVSLVVHKNHVKTDDDTHEIDNIFGQLIDPYIDSNDELRAKEYHWNTEHSFSKDFSWALKNVPHAIGFSVSGDVAKPSYDTQSQKLVIKECYGVDGFDLVSRPANTGNILEQTGNITMPTLAELFDQLGTQLASDASMGINVKKQRLALMYDSINDGKSEIVISESEKYDNVGIALRESEKYKSPLIVALRTVITSQQQELAERAKQLDEYKVKEAFNTRLAKAREKQIPELYITNNFKTLLANAKDDAEANNFIDEQYKLYESTKNNTGKGGVISHPQDPPIKPEPFNKEKAKEELLAG